VEETARSTSELAKALGVGRRTIQDWRRKYEDCPKKDPQGRESVTLWKRWFRLHPELRVARAQELEDLGDGVALALPPSRRNAPTSEPGEDAEELEVPEYDRTPGLEGTVARLEAQELRLFDLIWKGNLGASGAWLNMIEQIRKQRKDLYHILELEGTYVRVGDISEIEARRLARFKAVLMAMKDRVAAKCEGCTYAEIAEEIEAEVTTALNILSASEWMDEDERVPAPEAEGEEEGDGR
jgi:transposase-like protein